MFKVNLKEVVMFKIRLAEDTPGATVDGMCDGCNKVRTYAMSNPFPCYGVTIFDKCQVFLHPKDTMFHRNNTGCPHKRLSCTRVPVKKHKTNPLKASKRAAK